MLPLRPTAAVLVFLFSFCTGVDLIDGYVTPVIRITSSIRSAPVGKSITFEASYFNNVGMPVEEATIVWISSNPEILSVDTQGQGNTLKEGRVIITAQIITEEGTTLSDTLTVAIISNVILEEMEEELPVEESQEETMTLSPTLEIINRIAEITQKQAINLRLHLLMKKETLAVPPHSHG